VFRGRVRESQQDGKGIKGVVAVLHRALRKGVRPKEVIAVKNLVKRLAAKQKHAGDQQESTFLRHGFGVKKVGKGREKVPKAGHMATSLKKPGNRRRG